MTTETQTTKERCPTCGAPVDSIFDHIVECPPEPEGGYPATTIYQGTFAESFLAIREYEDKNV